MIDLVVEMSRDWAGRIILALAAIVIGLLLSLPFLVRQAAEEQKQWEAFAAEHQCRVVAVAPGVTTMIPVVAGGTTVLVPQTIPSRTTYHCDDGKNYTR